MAEDAQMKIRLSHALKRQIETAAVETNRTLNGEIVARLERTFIEDSERGGLALKAKGLATAELVSRLDDHERRIALLEKIQAEKR